MMQRQRLPEKNYLHYGDCLPIMQSWPEEFVNLIYLDPPFNSKANYNVIFGDAKEKGSAQVAAFTDTWEWNITAAERVENLKNSQLPAGKAIFGFEAMLGPSGMLSYLSYLALRLQEMYRILKPAGSIYLHCDPTAGHYLKLLMDAIFGKMNFRNEIIWCYTTASTPRIKQFPRNSDTIFWYSKGDHWTFNRDNVRVPYKGGRPHGGRKWAKEGEDLGDWREKKAREGKIVQNWWADIYKVSSKERMGYPTQKPVALLERIIKASSNPGDLVLDPFCGCGTTIAAADRADRHWLGIDISYKAIRIIDEERFPDRHIHRTGIPFDLEAAQALAQSDRFHFEGWAIDSIDGLMSNKKKRGDGGIDGRGTLQHPVADFPSKSVIAQVKSGKVNISDFRAFRGALERSGAAFGVYITMRPTETPSTRQEIAAAGTLSDGNREYPRLQILSVQEILKRVQPDLPPMTNPITGKPLQLSLGAALL